MDKNELYFWDSLRIINVCIQQVEEGQPEFYRVIAAQLRMLLCDTTREHGKVVDVSLLPRVISDARLQPFDRTGSFLNTKDAVPLEKWLEQKIPWQIRPLTIRDLIRSVCEQDGGVHVDPQHKLRVRQKIAKKWILSIARYLAEVNEG